MVRETKDPEVRRQEILDAADKLFRTKGYGQTSTGDILNEARIARGTLYYYFSSKDALLNAVIERHIDEEVKWLKGIVNSEKLCALEKLKLFVMQTTKSTEHKESVVEYLHTKDNEVLHLRSFVMSVEKYSPLVACIIEQGINENIFATEYATEISEFVMVITSVLLDSFLFPRDTREYLRRISALEFLLEKGLSAEDGSLDFLTKVVKNRIRGEEFP